MAILESGWAVTAAGVAGCPSVMTTDGGTRIIAGTSDGNILALDGAGKEVWRTPVGGTVSAWPVVDQVPDFGRSILAATEESPLRSASSLFSVSSGSRWCHCSAMPITIAQVSLKSRRKDILDSADWRYLNLVICFRAKGCLEKEVHPPEDIASLY